MRESHKLSKIFIHAPQYERFLKLFGFLVKKVPSFGLNVFKIFPLHYSDEVVMNTGYEGIIPPRTTTRGANYLPVVGKIVAVASPIDFLKNDRQFILSASFSSSTVFPRF